MNNFQVQMAYAIRTGKCPVCRVRPRARWRDGAGLRVTCGEPLCYHKWLPGGKNMPLDVFTLPSEVEEVRA